MTLREWCASEEHPITAWDMEGPRCICGVDRLSMTVADRWAVFHSIPHDQRMMVPAVALDGDGPMRAAVPGA